MALRTLRMGMRGPDVKAVQQGLNTRDGGVQPKLLEDGVFGTNTDKAVREYQARHGLKSDGAGAVGRETRNSLFPLGLATVTVSGMQLRLPDFPSLGPKLKPPSLLPGTLRFPGDANAPIQASTTTFTSPGLSPGTLRFSGMLPSGWYNSVFTGLSSLSFRPLSLPLLPSPIHAPLIPDWDFTIPPPPRLELTPPFGFVYDHLEVQPGAQSTFPIRGRRQDAFVLTMQSVYRRGPDDGSHSEADLGVQIGAPFTAIPANGNPWTFNPFVQLTDVDRLGPLGFFHFWQPYAQVGPGISGPGDPEPTITGSLFPVNLGLDVGDVLTVGLGAGLAFSLDLRTMSVQAAPQATFGISLKLGRATGPF
jgi:hypothetical protein